MKLIFLLRHGTLTWEVPDMDPPFDFRSAVAKIRCDGFFASNEMYIRHDDMVGILLETPGVPAQMPAPHGQTMQ